MNHHILSFFTVIYSLSLAIVSNAQPTFLPGEDPKPADSKWVKVKPLSDEFEGKKVNTKKWQIEPKANGWGWIGRPPGLFRAENVQIQNGKLAVTVGVLDSTVTLNDKEFIYQGGIVRSIAPAQVGWYYECKMKANATEMSSTFWLMSRYDCEKKLELDIQECVGHTTELSDEWAREWDQIYHSNAIHRPTECVERLQLQKSIKTDVKNHERYFVYAAWWKSPEEIQFFLDGKYVYSIHPEVAWDMPAFLHMAIETYSWNPVPEDGGMVKRGNWEQRTTQYEWIRTWKLKE
ncbi:hypothetical protein SAMN04488028_10799 [Reichenbachiella agariperforans]|uniref:GH16 domain-containing protein n=1 Tax=Reichenbachiella agariperforans TaxID=156994 RepID=A0A1M6UFC3_REIAG|nr:glycosyl hydrolase [Reichenbachiella agariperforans]SHK67965.1 hypothetical protein SAMN04488028_10799 [Reichenbachiella agariperforans]